MKLIVIGDGKVGRAIVDHASKEEHQIVVIDTKPEAIEQIVEKYDVMGVCGNGASYDIQKNERKCHLWPLMELPYIVFVKNCSLVW